MLMKTRPEPIDFHLVDPKHQKAHAELENWARLVRVTGMRWVHPIWKMGKSNGRQWDVPVLVAEIDKLSGWKVEKAVAALPEKHREALRWCYCYKDSPARQCRALGLTYEGLSNHIRAGRQMVINRGVLK
mgnify:CR=1 FL=1